MSLQLELHISGELCDCARKLHQKENSKSAVWMERQLDTWKIQFVQLILDHKRGERDEAHHEIFQVFWHGLRTPTIDTIRVLTLFSCVAAALLEVKKF